MRVNQDCITCLFDKQRKEYSDPAYLQDIKDILDSKREEMTSPYLSYLFDQAYEKRYGYKNPKHVGFKEINKQYNDLVLTMETEIRNRIEESSDPLKTALFLSRVGNYIDFGAMDDVNPKKFMELLFSIQISEQDEKTYQSFINQCKSAKSFLLLADNCGEIVLDKFFLETLHQKYPNIHLYIMVRDSEINNDATPVDANYIHLEDVATVITNGACLAGTDYSMLDDSTKEIFDTADIVLAKGMGNYESASSANRVIFYSFLCKCNVFANRFNVERFTGMFIEE